MKICLNIRRHQKTVRSGLIVDQEIKLLYPPQDYVTKGMNVSKIKKQPKKQWFSLSSNGYIVLVRSQLHRLKGKITGKTIAVYG